MVAWHGEPCFRGLQRLESQRTYFTYDPFAVALRAAPTRCGSWRHWQGSFSQAVYAGSSMLRSRPGGGAEEEDTRDVPTIGWFFLNAAWGSVLNRVNRKPYRFFVRRCKIAN